jgi:hypothetical protein
VFRNLYKKLTLILLVIYLEVVWIDHVENLLLNCFCYYGFLVLKLAIVTPPVFLFLLRIALTIWGILCFHMDFRIVFSMSIMNVIRILTDIASNLCITFANMIILTILVLPVHECGCLSIF